MTLPARFDLQCTAGGPTPPCQCYEAVSAAQIYGVGGKSAGWSSVGPVPCFDADIPDTVYPSMPGFDDLAQAEPLLRDGHALDVAKTFKVRVAGSVNRVRVRVVLGRPDKPVSNMHVYNYKDDTLPEREVTVDRQPHSGVTNWPDVQRGALARTLANSGKFNAPVADNFGGFRSIWFDRPIGNNNGIVTIQFTPEDDATLLHDGEVAVAAIELYSIDDDGGMPAGPDAWHSPATFTMGPPMLDVNTAYMFSGGAGAAFATGVFALMQNNVAGAYTAFDGIPDGVDDYAKATGLLWVAGWLDDESADDAGVVTVTGNPMFAQDGIEWECLERAITLLESGLTPISDINPYAREDLERARAYRRALVHQIVGEYKAITVPYDGNTSVPNPFSWDPDAQGKGIRNRNVAESIWRDLTAQHMGTWLTEYGQPDVRGLRIHPLFFRAAVYLGANWYARDTLYNGETAFLEQKLELWEAFDEQELREYPAVAGTYGGLFAAHTMIGLMQHAHLYNEAGTPIYPLVAGKSIGASWKGEGKDVVYGTDPSFEYWWDDLVLDNSGACTTASWAEEQLELRQRIVSLARWWNTHSMFGGEYGGGGNDDVELMQLWLLAGRPFPGADTVLDAGVRAITDKNLFVHEDFFPDDPGSEPCKSSDAEHNGETVGNPLRTGLGLDATEPFLLDYARRATELMAKPIIGGWDWMGIIDETVYADYMFSLVGTVHTDPARGAPLDLRFFLAWVADASGAVYEPPASPPASIMNDDVSAGLCAMSESRGDIPLNGRVLQPAIFSTPRYRNPKVMQLLREWAEMWWFVAMDHDGILYNDLSGTPPDSQKKPFGVFPPVIDVESNRIVYGNPNEPIIGDRDWFEPPQITLPSGSTSEPLYGSTIRHTEFFYHLFLQRATDPETPAAERADYLLPIYAACRYFAKKQAANPDDPDYSALLGSALPDLAPVPGNPQGSPGWLTNLLVTRNAIRWQVARALPDLHANVNAIEARLPAGIADDATVIGIVLEGARRYLRDNGGAYLSSLMATESPGLDRVTLEASFAEQRAWIEAAFPLLSTVTFATDKVLMKQSPPGSASSGADTLLASTTGQPLTATPAPAVTWEPERDPETGFASELPLAVLVEGWSDPPTAGGSWHAEVSSKLPSGPDRRVTLRFHAGFPQGDYSYTFGEVFPPSGIQVLALGSFGIGVLGGTLPLDFPAGCDRTFDIQLNRTGAGPTDLIVDDVGVSGRDICTDVNLLVQDPSTTVTFRWLGNAYSPLGGSAPPVDGNMRIDTAATSVGNGPGAWTLGSVVSQTLMFTVPPWNPDDPTDVSPLQSVTDALPTQILPPTAGVAWLRVVAWCDGADDEAGNDRAVAIYRVTGTRLKLWSPEVETSPTCMASPP